MSTKQPSDQEPVEQGDDVEVEKEVTVVAYSPEDFDLNPRGSDNERDFCDLIVPSRDYWETKTKKSTTYYIVFGNGRRVEVGQSQYQEVAEDIASGDLEDVQVDKETETSESYKNWTHSAGRRFRDEVVMDRLPETVADGRLTKNGSQYQDDAGNCVLQINASQSRDRVLAHHDRRSDENRYESPDERRSVTLTLSIGPLLQSVVETASDELVAALYDVFDDEGWCEKVRVAECEVTRKGDCFV